MWNLCRRKESSRAVSTDSRSIIYRSVEAAFSRDENFISWQYRKSQVMAIKQIEQFYVASCDDRCLCFRIDSFVFSFCCAEFLSLRPFFEETSITTLFICFQHIHRYLRIYIVLWLELFLRCLGMIFCGVWTDNIRANNANICAINSCKSFDN